MKFLTYNIQYGKGKDGLVDVGRIISEIDGADVIALQEVDRFWPRTDCADQVEQITNAMPDHYWVYGAGVDMHADQYTETNRGVRRQFGNLILSRYPIVFSRHHLLPKYGSIDPISIQRSAIEATILCGTRLLRVFSVHLTHLSAQTRIPQIEKLLDIHRNAIHEGFPVSGKIEGFNWESGIVDQSVAGEAIIMGDFNCRPDSDEYLKMTGPVSEYGGQITSPAGFVDAWTYCGHDRMTGSTTDVNGVPARLDYCFISTSLRHLIKNCNIDEQAQGSDHQPVRIDITL